MPELRSTKNRQKQMDSLRALEAFADVCIQRQQVDQDFIGQLQQQSARPKSRRRSPERRRNSSRSNSKSKRGRSDSKSQSKSKAKASPKKSPRQSPRRSQRSKSPRQSQRKAEEQQEQKQKEKVKKKRTIVRDTSNSSRPSPVKKRRTNKRAGSRHEENEGKSGQRKTKAGTGRSKRSKKNGKSASKKDLVVIDKRLSPLKNQIQYKVRWGTAQDSITWEPAATLLAFDDALIKAYELISRMEDKPSSKKSPSKRPKAAQSKGRGSPPRRQLNMESVSSPSVPSAPSRKTDSASHSSSSRPTSQQNKSTRPSSSSRSRQSATASFLDEVRPALRGGTSTRPARVIKPVRVGDLIRVPCNLYPSKWFKDRGILKDVWKKGTMDGKVVKHEDDGWLCSFLDNRFNERGKPSFLTGEQVLRFRVDKL